MDDVQATLEAFVNRNLPGYVEKMERVQGGFINFTYRLNFKYELPPASSDNSNDHSLLASIRQSKPKSLIAKIACPYLAGAGQAAPFSVSRQRMEENALKLFIKTSLPSDDAKSTLIDLSSVLDRNKTIRLSKVWFRDDTDNILLMDDHGPLHTITQWLSTENTKASSTESIVAAAEAHGEHVANFLVDMQVSSLPHIEQLEVLFRNPELQQSISKTMVSSFEKMRHSHNLHDADEIASIFIRCFQYDATRAPTDGQVLSHGDYNAPNLLINEQNSTVAIIDWELARVRSPAHDIALFLARAHLFLDLHPTNKSMLNFANGFMDGYRESAKKNDVNWYKNEREQYLFAWYLGVAYGVTLVRWSPLQQCCPPQEGICSHQRTVVALGLDYIRRCRSGPEKATYDSISGDQFLGRLFQTSHTN